MTGKTARQPDDNGDNNDEFAGMPALEDAPPPILTAVSDVASAPPRRIVTRSITGVHVRDYSEFSYQPNVSNTN